MSVALPQPQPGLSVAAGGLTHCHPAFPLPPPVPGGAVQGPGMMPSFAGIGALLGALGPALGIDADTIRVAGAR